jgi:phosphatidate cytidylyltransferase
MAAAAMTLDDPVTLAVLAMAGIAAAGLVGAGIFAVARRGRADGLRAGTALARAGSYAGLAGALVAAGLVGVPGIAAFVAIVSGIGLLEWARLFNLPIHHRISLLVADAVLVLAIGMAGVGAADWLVGGLVLVGAAWPVIRADTGHAIRDLGIAAVGFMVIPVLLVHGLALAVELGGSGIALFLALAVACAGSDVAAFVIGRRFGRRPLAPRLSPAKTQAGAIGNLVGAMIGLVPFAPALVPSYGIGFVVGLVPVVAGGSLWGDLLESAVKREAGVKDVGTWLPGFGGILDRIDSLLVTLGLAYWLIRLSRIAA